MSVKNRFVIYILIAYLFWIGYSYLYLTLAYGSILLTPGFFFSMAIALSVEETLVKRIVFVISSTAIYFLALSVSFINAYWGPDLQYLICGSIIGAILEILNFYIVFKISGRLKTIYFILGLIIGGISFLLVNNGNSLGTYIGFAIWQGGIGFVLYKMYSQNKGRVSVEAN